MVKNVVKNGQIGKMAMAKNGQIGNKKWNIRQKWSKMVRLLKMLNSKMAKIGHKCSKNGQIEKMAKWLWPIMDKSSINGETKSGQKSS